MQNKPVLVTFPIIAALHLTRGHWLVADGDPGIERHLPALYSLTTSWLKALNLADSLLG